MIGREADLAAVTRALSGAGALVLVEGEAGIGKSRLLDECLATPGLRERRVLVAACPPLAEPFPLGAVVEGLRPFHGRLADLRLSPLAGALRPLFPEWAALLPPALEALRDPRETRHRLFRALTELVGALGVEIIAVEDAHWADPATLDWLLTLAASRSRDHALVLTYRPLDVAPGSPLLRLTSRSPAARVSLEPLDVPQTRALVEAMFGAPEVSERFAAFLHEHTGGIPFALEETVRLLRERRDIFRSDSGWRRRLMEELSVPPTVRDSVLERVARLAPQTRAVLRAAAVLAAPAEEALLGAVAGLDEHGTRDGLAGALAGGLMREVERGAFGFRHVLAARAVGDAIPAPERRLLHRRAGRALRDGEHPPVVRLCRHFREAGDVGAWSEYAEASAELALESGDGHTTVATLHELLTTAEHPLERRVRLARRLGEAVTLSAEPLSELGRKVRAALGLALADPELPSAERGELRLRLGRLKLHLGEYEEGLSDLEAAVPELEHRPTLAAQAMLLLATPFNAAWPADRHRAWADAAVRIFAQVRSPAERLVCLNSLAIALLLLGDADGWQVVSDLPEAADSRLERRELARGRLAIGQLATVWGRHTEAARLLDTAAELVEDTGYRRVDGTVAIGRARLAWHQGEWAGLAERVGELAVSESADQGTRLEAALLQGQLDLASGARVRAERRLRRLLASVGPSGHADPFTAPNAALGRLLLDAGDVTGALACTGRAMDVIVGKGVWLWATDPLPVHLDALVATGQVAQARATVSAFAAGLAGRDAPAPAAALLVCRGIVARAAGAEEEAAARFAQAALAWEELPRPYDRWLTAERQGHALLAADRREQALAAWSAAQEGFVALGARWDADRVAHVLRGHGVGVARPWRGGRRGYGDRLSPREREIVARAAQGWTNKRIAEDLSLSPRTVERHLSAAMRKLSVTTRTALVAASAGLLDADS
ncbi:ATP-binding protein [Nonomuraea longicatena]